MNIEEVHDKIKGAINEIIADAISSYFDNATKPENIEEFVRSVIESPTFRNGFKNYFEKYIATEIGNQLRVWYPTGSNKLMDKAFEDAWTPALEAALKERIRSKTYGAVDKMIAERLEEIKGKLN